MGVIMKTKILAVLTLYMLLPTAATAGEESPGERILRLADETMTRAQDQYFIQDLITHEPGKEPRKIKMKAQIKGTKWRRVEFLEPGDVKGMKVLVRSVNQMYVYLPAYRKVRRVASHVRSQGFMGTAFGFDDMSTVVYGDVLRGELMEETDVEVTSEFLLIAATLIQLKARHLLPGDREIDIDEELALAEERDRLLARLLACLTFKDVAAVLEKMLKVISEKNVYQNISEKQSLSLQSLYIKPMRQLQIQRQEFLLQ